MRDAACSTCCRRVHASPNAPVYLPYISRISPVYLPCISRVSPVNLLLPARACLPHSTLQEDLGGA